MEMYPYGSPESRKRLRDIDNTPSPIPLGDLRSNCKSSLDASNCGLPNPQVAASQLLEYRRSDNSGYTLPAQRPDAAVEPPEVPAAAAATRRRHSALDTPNSIVKNPYAASCTGSSSTAPVTDRIPMNIAAYELSSLAISELQHQLYNLKHQESVLLQELRLTRQEYDRRVERLQLSSPCMVSGGQLLESVPSPFTPSSIPYQTRLTLQKAMTTKLQSADAWSELAMSKSIPKVMPPPPPKPPKALSPLAKPLLQQQQQQQPGQPPLQLLQQLEELQQQKKKQRLVRGAMHQLWFTPAANPGSAPGRAFPPALSLSVM